MPDTDAHERRSPLGCLLVAAGLSVDQVGGAIDLLRRSPAVPDQEVDGPLPPEVPPGIAAPDPYRRPEFVDVSARLVRSLRKDYGRGVPTDEGRAIGDIPEVAEWIEGLKPGKVRPR